LAIGRRRLRIERQVAVIDRRLARIERYLVAIGRPPVRLHGHVVTVAWRQDPTDRRFVTVACRDGPAGRCSIGDGSSGDRAADSTMAACGQEITRARRRAPRDRREHARFAPDR
jgi:hypothetical protein